jgi:hypothetical protein
VGLRSDTDSRPGSTVFLARYTRYSEARRLLISHDGSPELQWTVNEDDLVCAGKEKPKTKLLLGDPRREIDRRLACVAGSMKQLTWRGRLSARN